MRQVAIGDAMEITGDEYKEVSKRLQSLIAQLFQESEDLEEIGDVATRIIMSEPQYSGILRSIVSRAVDEATVKVYIRSRV